MSSKNFLTFWGWGRYPLPNLKRNIDNAASRLGMVFGIDISNDLIEIPNINDVHVNAPRFPLNDEYLKTFAVFNKEERVRHAYGKSSKDILRGLWMKYSNECIPDYVCYPKKNQDIIYLMKYCTDNNIALMTYGGGTSVVSGFEFKLTDYYKGIICCDISKMNNILDFDEISQTITVEGGLTGYELEKYLKEYYPKYTLRHYPQSFEFASIAGMVVTKSAGHFSIGKTRINDFVQSSTIITPQYGEINTPEIPSSGSALSPRIIIDGSEGIFGVLTKVKLKLLRKPKYKHSIVVEFENMEYLDASKYIRDMVQSGLEPTSARLISNYEAFFNGLTKNINNHAAIIAFESNIVKDFTGLMNAVKEIITDNNKTVIKGKAIIMSENKSSDHKQSNSNAKTWGKSFISAPYIRDYIFRMGLFLETWETCVSWTKLDTLHNNIVKLVHDMMLQYFGSNIKYILTQRFTHVYMDGVSIYWTFGVNSRALLKDKFNGNTKRYLEHVFNIWDKMKYNITSMIVKYGGSTTHHHAVGKDHAIQYLNEIGYKNMDWIIQMKKIFDPKWICNPGIVIPYVPIKGYINNIHKLDSNCNIHTYCPPMFAKIQSKL